MSPIIEFEGVSKSFGSTRALDGLDLRIEPGQVHAFLGPNGAGKTTTLRILLGALRADSGTARVFDLDPWADATVVHRRLAYVPGDVALWPNLTGAQVINLIGELRGGLDAHVRDGLVAEFELDTTKKCRTYSKGNRQKVALIAALASAAELYLLDEPTSGLDPLMEAIFQRHVRRLRDSGATILLSSHILSEAERLCDSVSIIRDGRMVDSGSLADMRHLHRTKVSADLDVIPPSVTSMVDAQDLVVDGHHLEVSVDPTRLGQLMSELSRAGIRSLTCEPPSLEQLFLSHYASEPSG